METDGPRISHGMETSPERQPVAWHIPSSSLEKEYSTSGRAEQQQQLPEGMAEVYQLKLALLGSKPLIWRRLQVPAAFSLAALHTVIQIVMGWSDEHLHQFILGERKRGLMAYFTDTSMDDDEDCLDERDARLDALLVKPKDTLRYEYDFGDSWMHRLVLEKILVRPSAEASVPRCVAGERACPPEDSGGVGGWESIREVLSVPSHPEYADWSEVFDVDFDPEAFDLETINTDLAKYFAPKSKRIQSTKTG